MFTFNGLHGVIPQKIFKIFINCLEKFKHKMGLKNLLNQDLHVFRKELSTKCISETESAVH
jgi:hypothetical protein